MLRTYGVAAIGVVAALWALWMPQLRHVSNAAVSLGWPWMATVLGACLVGLFAGIVPAAVAAALIGVCAWSFAAVPRSRHKVQAAESVAQFAAVLANQAQVSRTVIDALETAAPLATGPVADAAARLVSECRSLGVEAAAHKFALESETPAAAWLGDVVAVASASGGQWVPILGVLESEAAEAAVTARHFHRHVAANLPQIAMSAMLGAAVAVGAARVSPEAWAWLSGQQGQRVGLAAAVLAVVISAKPLTAAWEQLR